MPYNARAKQKKVQLSALIVCLRGIFEDKYYELSQKPKKSYAYLLTLDISNQRGVLITFR